MTSRLPALLISAALLAVGGAAAEEPRPLPVEREISFLAEDGVLLRGVVVFPDDPERAGTSRWPVAVLLHPFERDRDSVRALADALAEAGIAAVAMDQRGRGGSRTKPGVAQIYAMMAPQIEQEMRKVVADQALLLRELARFESLDLSRLAAVGVQEGGLVALEAASRRPEIRALVLVDVTGAAAGFRPVRDIAVYGPRPVLLVHSAVPRLAAQAERLAGYGQGERKLVAIDSFEAGAGLIGPGGPALPAIVHWLLGRLEAGGR